jgi:hypothetical protein
MSKRKDTCMASYTITKRNGKYSCQVRGFPSGSNKRRNLAKTFTQKKTAEARGQDKN